MTRARRPTPADHAELRARGGVRATPWLAPALWAAATWAAAPVLFRTVVDAIRQITRSDIATSAQLVRSGATIALLASTSLLAFALLVAIVAAASTGTLRLDRRPEPLPLAWRTARATLPIFLFATVGVLLVGGAARASVELPLSSPAFSADVAIARWIALGHDALGCIAATLGTLAILDAWMLHRAVAATLADHPPPTNHDGSRTPHSRDEP